MLSRILVALSLVAACTNVKPRHQNDESSHVSVAFDPAAIGELANQMKTLRFRIYDVQNDVRGAQEGQDNSQAIEAQKTEYTLEGIQLGWKDLEVSILDAQSNALGTGALRILVKPGLNQAGPLVVKIAPLPQTTTNLGIQLTLKSEAEADPASYVKKAVFAWKAQDAATSGEIELTLGDATIGFDRVLPVIEENCYGCHTASNNGNKKLKLSVYPFKSGLIADQGELLAKIMERVQNADSPMPQDGLMAQDKIDLMKAWQAGGFAAASTAAGSFRGELKDLKVTDKITGTLTLYGVDGVELAKQEIAAHTVEINGLLSFEAQLDLAAPSVAVQIVVER